MAREFPPDTYSEIACCASLLPSVAPVALPSTPAVALPGASVMEKKASNQERVDMAEMVAAMGLEDEGTSLAASAMELVDLVDPYHPHYCVGY